MTIPTNLNHGAKWAIVCQTVFQGLTMSQDDLYNTKLEADQELIELQSMLKEEDAADCGFSVIPVFVTLDHRVYDSFGELVAVN
jgi:hypothetical protein